MHRFWLTILLIAGTIGCCYWAAEFFKAALIDWVCRREAKLRRVETIRELLDGKPEMTIEWVIYGDKGKPHGVGHLIAAAIERRVRTWKSWQEWKSHGEREDPYCHL